MTVARGRGAVRSDRRGVWLLFLLLAVSPAGCKDGDSVDGVLAPAIASFVEDERSPTVTERYVSLRVDSSSGGTIVLDIVVSEVDEPVTAIAMKLAYDNDYSKFIRCQVPDPDLFGWSGACLADETEEGSGEVLIGRSITGIQQAGVVTGDQVVAQVEFLVFGEGASPLIIEGQNLGGGETSAVLDLDGDPILMQWFSGTLVGE